jgi:hypothetical protein
MNSGFFQGHQQNPLRINLRIFTSAMSNPMYYTGNTTTHSLSLSSALETLAKSTFLYSIALDLSSPLCFSVLSISLSLSSLAGAASLFVRLSLMASVQEGPEPLKYQVSLLLFSLKALLTCTVVLCGN